VARKTPGRPAPDDELKAVERTGAHDQPPASLFGSEAILGTAELDMVDVDLARTLAADPPQGLFDIPDPEERPVAQPVASELAVAERSSRPASGGSHAVRSLQSEPATRSASAAERRGNPPDSLPFSAAEASKQETRQAVRRAADRRPGALSDPEGPPLRSIPLPESDPPMDALDLDTRADDIPRVHEDPGTGIIDIPVPPTRSSAGLRRMSLEEEAPRPAPRRPPPPPARSAPPVPMPAFETSSPPRARAEVPSDPPEPSVVLDDPGFNRDESTRVFDRQAPVAGPVLPRGRLVVVQGDQVGKAWYLNRPLTFLGRGNDNDIVVLDIAASRKHLRLDRHAEGFRVQDLQSGNGTMLNGRRITREELYDGDRIEVGAHVLEFASLGTPRARPRDTGRVTDPGIAVRPMTPAPTGSVPRSWIIVWSLATFLAVFGAMYLTRMLRQGRREPAPAVVEPVVIEANGEAISTARRHLGVAREAMERRAWAPARGALEAARGTGAELPEINQELARLAAEEKAAMALRLAGAHLAGRQLAAARAALAEVPPESVYAPDARSMEAQIAAAEAPPGGAPPTAALPSVPASAAPPSAAPPSAAPPSAAPPSAAPPSAAPPSAARAAPRTAAPPAPAAPASRAAHREAPPSAARPPRAPRVAAKTDAAAPPAEEGDKDLFPQATAAYKGRRFAEAAAAFERAAKSGSADKRAQATAKARAVHTVAEALAQADAAEVAGRKGEAAAALERALAADRTLGGALASGLQPALARHLVYEALRDFIARKYVEAARKNRRAQALDPRLVQAQELARKLESQATLILDRARAADGAERRRLAEQVQQLVPANSTLARDAADLIKDE